MAEALTDTTTSKKKLVRDLQRVISDAEELLQATASETEGKVVEMRERIRENLMAAKHKLGDIEDTIAAKTKEAARVTDEYVHDHPWQAIGTAAGVGLLIGLLIGRR
ncbi:MAG: DUF883 domain-containing protein [Hydrogenophaga sp.]|jgi:ElaB/YqjD/DUF883 family membrane-anchored ribosome-binding protein|uniref:DUF883 domain-containing protein n=1 Tax=Hydrogenophaga crocea TaxID=2716225 RepID=A0A6G8IMU6_9BURK|nr:MULTISPECIES: DUF883 family protein [Hydrogenophaga]MBL0943091.1 DUF883 domain-containing protein [Hydrogenophaga sp.]QIM54504.1 DUF883 domain-containing protein [Hydrogenophaga crocea]